MTTLSLASILAESARRRPDHLALIEGEQRITFGEMWQQVRTQAAALVEAGVRPDDRVALMAPNTAEFPRAYYAILAAGGVVVPVHLLLSAEEVEHVLRDSGASLLLCHVAVAQVGLAAGTASGVRTFTVGPAVPQLQSVPRLEEQDAEPLPLHLTRDADDPAVIFYTSGTTGRPKGAVLTHLNMVLNATVNAFDANDARPDDIALGALPLFHSFGQTVSLNTMWRVGATVVLLPRFEAADAIALMQRERVNTFHGVPTMYVRLVEVARDLPELPQLKIAVSGGASLPVPVLEAFEKTFGTPVYEGYGLSETSPSASVNQPHFGTKAGSVGHALWGVDVEIARAEIDERIELLPTGELGEIVIRGHNVFSGYLGNPEATAAAVVDGWFRTGDLGTKDAEGFITIVDRKKDLIIRGGFNVYPREVEEVLLRYPGLSEAAVIGVPDPVHGEEICAVVVGAPGSAVDTAALVEFAKEHLGRHKYPRRVEVVDQLPLGPSLKVLKRELRQQYR
ncbi:long-chain-fatty-acid--CoA ligase [Cryptosporangium aurantiacum]|uniref:Long-chain acyl-CoA synthetase n=1 Tax=Cryptosporangium aurantiacum TaxID=134849 RepID=A0A1M7JQM9_9ACTN|nr:long-chain fatty acid--CoA ligase [Cryptosporangium aurantiacum]SHM55221.1 long-chain acyl-CoA synthetase [Cryptosporangium aurantiacum]